MLQDNIVSCSDSLVGLKKILAEKNGETFGERYQNKTFKNFDSENKERAYGICMRAAEAISNGEKKSVMITGPVGTGKTHLAVAIAQYCMEHGVVVKFGNITDLLQNMKRAFTKKDDILPELESVPLLVIDDLGKEVNTEWVQETMYSMLNYRYEHMLSTVITTNLSMSELQERLGEATVSRLVEMCEYVATDGKDHRKGARK